ncbi:hypothetical protein HG531_007391 [Fusarium graminearum]|nr:hypothetical protein HG531_007391 [Fusarium graminearum]
MRFRIFSSRSNLPGSRFSPFWPRPISRGELEHFILAEVERIPESLKLDAGVFDEEVEVLTLEFIQAAKLVFELINLSDTTATFDPEGLNGSSELVELLFPVLLLVCESITLGTESADVFLMQAELLRSITVVLDDGSILLRLRDTKLCPESNRLVGKRLNGGNTTRILFINSCKLTVELVNISGRKVKVGRNGLVWVCRGQWDLDESRLKM